DNHQASINSHSQGKLKSMFETDLFRVFFDPLLNFQSRQYCALWIILMRNGSAEECQNSIAHQPWNCALIFIDWTDHVFENTVHDIRPRFGIQFFCGSWRTPDIT